MLTIAVLALIGFIVGVVWDIFISYHDKDIVPSPRCFLSAVLVVSWWSISTTFAIILLILAIIWLIMCIVAYAMR